jgi:AcrR family transcriptional regulator
MAERWTQERRREHTRNLLLDAAEEVFAERGFEGASLEDIAQRAGYTRGAIYKHFSSKADLFVAISTRFNSRFLTVFENAVEPGTRIEDLDMTTIAKLWHEAQVQDPKVFAYGLEFNLYVLRHPEELEEVRRRRRELAELIASFIQQEADHLGETLAMPAITVARLVLATSDGLQLASFLDGDQEEDLYVPFLELLKRIWAQPAIPEPPRAAARPRKSRT